MKKKDQSIETLRGLAILLVVAGYIIKEDLAPAAHSGFTSSLEIIYYYLKPIRMPLFTVISSYLYAASPATQENLKKLIHGKMRRLMIPFTVVSAIQYTLFSIFHVNGIHPIQKLFHIYLWPFEQFWFLYSVFCIFILIGFLDSIKALETKIKWLGVLALAVVSSILFEPTYLFSIHGTIYLLPFFLLGYGIHRFSASLFSPAMIKIYIVTSILAYGVYTFLYTADLSTISPFQKVTGLIISFSMVPLIFHWRKNVPFLARIGYYAFGIHIFNKISVVFPKLLFGEFHITNDVLMFFTYMLCSVVFSIGIQIFCENFNPTRKYILGIKEVPRAVQTNIAPAVSIPVMAAAPVLVTEKHS